MSSAAGSSLGSGTGVSANVGLFAMPASSAPHGWPWWQPFSAASSSGGGTPDVTFGSTFEPLAPEVVAVRVSSTDDDDDEDEDEDDEEEDEDEDEDQDEEQRH